MIVLALILAAGILCGIFVIRHMAGRTNFRPDEEVIRIEETETEKALKAADIYSLEGVTVADEEQRKGVYTLLVIGGGTPEDEEGGQREDAQAVILMTINHNFKECYFESFDAGLYVEIPEASPGMLGHAYALGGGPLLSETIEKNYGVAVDNYASISLKDVAEVIGMKEFETLDVSHDGLEVVEELVHSLHAVRPAQVAGHISKLLPFVTHNIDPEQMMRIILQIPVIVGYVSDKEMIPYQDLCTTVEGYPVADAAATSQRLKKRIYGE